MRTSALQYLYLQKPITTVILISAIALLPWLNSDFYTKGEPREASVAVSMIKTGNWILPTTYAGEFAYKPPMAHWLMALLSLPQGHVTEFTSRLPSALAQIILIGFVLAFFGKRIRFQEAFIATLLLLTCFEIHRAGITARVDMLLTTFTVLGLMQLYRWENKLELKGLPLPIPLLFSCAILTKGPVGIILPTFVYLIYLLTLRKYSLLKILKSLLYINLSSLFLPMLWYIEAYRQGGEAFLNVILAENLGRFFHLSEANIHYDLGHKEGPFYNILTLLSGFTPWTLLLLLPLLGRINLRRRLLPRKKPLRQILQDLRKRFHSMEKMKRFSLIASLCILIFYTIPSSKRSVYLMPAYPFLSILLAQYILYITENYPKIIRLFARILTCAVTLIITALLLIITHTIDLPSIAGKYTTKATTLQTLENLTNALTPETPSVWIILTLLLLSLIIAIHQATKRINLKILYTTLLLTYCINLFTDGLIMRSIKNTTSARPFAEQILRTYPLENNLYVMNNLREYGNLYGMNFYLGNTFRDFEKEHPSVGYLLIIEKDAQKCLKQYGVRYKFTPLSISAHQGDLRSKALLFRFVRQ
jgi:4-amino-4-deoxy-L-arabinose transferase-like glycosyltransferase